MFGTYFVKDQQTQIYLGIAYMASNGIMAIFMMFSVGLSSTVVMKAILTDSINAMSEDKRDPRMLSMVQKLNICIRELRNNGISTVGGQILFCVWPYLFNKQVSKSERSGATQNDESSERTTKARSGATINEQRFALLAKNFRCPLRGVRKFRS